MVDSIFDRLQYFYSLPPPWLNLLLHEPQIHLQWLGDELVKSL